MIGAVDIGGTKIAVGMVDDDGKVLSRMEAPTDPDRYADGMKLIARLLRETAAQAGVEITGIGIGSTGPVDPVRGEFGEIQFLPGWRGQKPVRDLETLFHVRAALENDGDAAALAEAGWGAARNRSRLIYITVGTGIGGGIILDGKLYRGVDGAHPEVGHHVVDPAGPACSCGFNGCWESLAAGPAMVAWFESRLENKIEKKFESPHASHAPDGDPDRPGITAKRICELAGAGDPLALQAVEHEAFYLGLGLANLINLFTPDTIVLSGSVMKSAPLFMDRVRAVIGRGCRFVPAQKTQLTLASLGEDTNLIGAARVWHYHFAQG